MNPRISDGSNPSCFKDSYILGIRSAAFVEIVPNSSKSCFDSRDNFLLSFGLMDSVIVIQ